MSTTVREVSVSNAGNAGVSDFTDDIFEGCFYNVDTFVDRCTLTSVTVKEADVNMTMASLVVATLMETTSRTATVPTVTRRTIASTTAKECKRHRVHIRKHPLLSLAKGLV